MRSRHALVLAAVAVAAVGSLTPAAAAPKEIKGSWTTPNLVPEPSNGGHCAPRIPQARATKAYVVPGPGTLTMTLANKLDWAADLRDSKGDVLAESDSTDPVGIEGVVVKFTKKTSVVMGACNLAGEPSVVVNWTFRPKKK